MILTSYIIFFRECRFCDEVLALKSLTLEPVVCVNGRHADIVKQLARILYTLFKMLDSLNTIARL